MNILRNYISKVFYKLYTVTSRQNEYFSPSEKDVYLVSYPRSGNTWMRVILAELIYSKSGESLNDLGYYIPDIYWKPKKEDVIKSEFNVIKSHELFSIPQYGPHNKVIYIIRDPRDVVISYFKYKTAFGLSIQFDQFVFDWINGRIKPSSWQEHINSWTGKGIENHKMKIHYVKYEDLLINSFEEVKKISEFINIKKSRDEIENAIKKASLEKMQKKEELGFRDDIKDVNYNFIGPGKSRNWEKFLSSSQENEITQLAHDEMERFGYI